MKPVTLHPEARVELLEAADYYESCCSGLGREFTDGVVHALGRIAERPASFATRSPQGLRRCVVARFPFSLFFLELRDTIWVVAVAHSARKPDYWQARLRPPPC